MPTTTKLGDIFWDLPPHMYYVPGQSIGCTIYVANHTDIDREYMIMGYLYQDGFKLEEVPLQIHRFAWFEVQPGVFTRLHGNITLDKTNVDLVVELIERESESTTDSISTRLVMPRHGVLPPAEEPTTPGLESTMLPLLMLMMLMMVMDMVDDLSDKVESNSKSTKMITG